MQVLQHRQSKVSTAPPKSTQMPPRFRAKAFTRRRAAKWKILMPWKSASPKEISPELAKIWLRIRTVTNFQGSTMVTWVLVTISKCSAIKNQLKNYPFNTKSWPMRWPWAIKIQLEAIIKARKVILTIWARALGWARPFSSISSITSMIRRTLVTIKTYSRGIWAPQVWVFTRKITRVRWSWKSLIRKEKFSHIFRNNPKNRNRITPWLGSSLSTVLRSTHPIKTIIWPILPSKILWVKLALFQLLTRPAQVRPKRSSLKTQTLMFSKSIWAKTTTHLLLSICQEAPIKRDLVLSTRERMQRLEISRMGRLSAAQNSKSIQFSREPKRTSSTTQEFQYPQAQMGLTRQLKHWWMEVLHLRKISQWWSLRTH